ncbi:MAG: DNA polymerase IV [Caldisericaceae bacterium]
MDRIIMHVDMDAFFASIEQAQKPWLRGKPIAVSGNPNGRSVIATASYEARVYGIKSGMPLGKARHLYPNLIVLKGNIAEYDRISNELYNVFLGFAPAVERFSIDEVFMDFSYLVKSFEEAYKIGHKIKETVKENFGITCTIGISVNKLMSKIAAKLVKPDGIIVIRGDETDNVLKDLPVGKITGIGKRTELVLKNEFGVEKVSDLQKIPMKDLVRVFHSYGNFLYNASRGIDDSPVVTALDREDAKSVGNSVTFDYDTDNIVYIKAILRMLSSHVALRLRESNFVCEVLTITIRYEDFYTITHRKVLFRTNTDRDIYQESINLFNDVYNGSKVRLLGVSASKLTHSKNGNGLFDEEHLSKETKLLEAMDSSRKLFGFKITEYGNENFLHKSFVLTDKKISGV